MKKFLLFLTTCSSLTMSAAFLISCHSSKKNAAPENIEVTDENDVQDSESECDDVVVEEKIPVYLNEIEMKNKITFARYDGMGFAKIDNLHTFGYSIEVATPFKQGGYKNGDEVTFNVKIEEGYELKSGTPTFKKEVVGLKKIVNIDNQKLNDQILFTGQNGFGTTSINQDFQQKYTIEKDYDNDGSLRNGDQVVFSIIPGNNRIVLGNAKFQKTVSGLDDDLIILNRSQRELKSTISVDGINGQGVVTIDNQLIDGITITADNESQMTDASNGEIIVFSVNPERGCALGPDTVSSFGYLVSGLPNEINENEQNIKNLISISGNNGSGTAISNNISSDTKYKLQNVHGGVINLKNGDVLVYNVLPIDGYVLSDSTPKQVIITINNLI